MLRRLMAVAGVATLVAASEARGAVVVPADLSSLTKTAHIIVHGRVVGLQAQWVDGRPRIETLVTVDASDYYKGDLGSRFVIRVPGGEMGRYRVVTPGAPSFREGDEVVLFLGAQPPALPYVLGLGQGVFRIVQDPETGSSVVIPPPLVAAGGQPQLVQRGDPQRRPPLLEAFATQVRSIVTRQARTLGPRGRQGAPGGRVRDKQQFER